MAAFTLILGFFAPRAIHYRSVDITGTFSESGKGVRQRSGLPNILACTEAAIDITGTYVEDDPGRGRNQRVGLAIVTANMQTRSWAGLGDSGWSHSGTFDGNSLYLDDGHMSGVATLEGLSWEINHTFYERQAVEYTRFWSKDGSVAQQPDGERWFPTERWEGGWHGWWAQTPVSCTTDITGTWTDPDNSVCFTVAANMHACTWSALGDQGWRYTGIMDDNVLDGHPWMEEAPYYTGLYKDHLKGVAALDHISWSNGHHWVKVNSLADCPSLDKARGRGGAQGRGIRGARGQLLRGKLLAS